MTATNSPVHNTATAQANLETGEIEAFAVFYTSAERLFRALTTKEICNWWVRPGVFNTQEWSGDLREGGRWAAAGIGGGKPYQLDGEFVTVDAPYQLSHTWRSVGAPGGPSLVTYGLATLWGWRASDPSAYGPHEPGHMRKNAGGLGDELCQAPGDYPG